jgi:queuine tRNA-ribosyltransferase
MLEMLGLTTPYLPENKPRYLMGVGTPLDIVEAVALGVDMFDCVMPTRSGRHGQAFTWSGKINLRNAAHIEDSAPLDEASGCPAATQYSRAYLHHLFRSGEYLGPMLLSWANTWFYQDLMARMREAIAEGRFAEFRERIRAIYPPSAEKSAV